MSEYSPYESDLDWNDVTEPDEIDPLVAQLGRATTKIHCVSDDDSDSDIVDFSVEQVVSGALGDVEAFAEDLAAFGAVHALRARRDHHLLVEAFPAGAFDAVTPTTT